MTNAYCKRHQEMEPQQHDEALWVCQECLKENEANSRLLQGPKRLDKVIEEMAQTFAMRRL